MTSHVLFVCTGNICRSPFAEYQARQVWKDSDVTISSAGTLALVGHRATKQMTAVGASYGLDLTPHRAQSLLTVDQPDLVLCMEQRHLEVASRSFPDLPDGAIRLLVGSGVSDPYGRGMDAYERSAAVITRGIEAVQLSDSH